MPDEEEPPPRPRPKRLLIVLAGGADPPGDATPLVLAETPALDRMARLGRPGTATLAARSPWEGFTELLGLLAPPSFGAAEALGAGIAVGEGETVYRADFVTVSDGLVADPFGGKVKDPEAALLLDALAAAMPSVRLARLGGHRNLAILRGPPEFAPSPWEMVGRKPIEGLPASGLLRETFDAASAALAAHDVNAVRVDLCENPANALWLHGGGAAAQAALPRGATDGRAVLVGRGAATAGLARAAGFDASVTDGDDEALAAAALDALAASGTVVVRTESVLDAAGLSGAQAKRDALSQADARLVAPLLSAAEESDAFVVAVAADSVFDSASRVLVRRPVPLVVYGIGGAIGHDARFSDSACEKSGFRLASGAELASRVFAG